MVPRKARREIISEATVLQTDTGVRGEYPQVRERTLVKELGKFTPYVRKKQSRLSFARGSVGRSEEAQPTVY